jgi:hypothetical protein
MSVTNHRRYRDKPSYPVPVWNGILDHAKRIGPALWEFLWCLDKITEEREGSGIVLGGMPVKVATIAADLEGSCKETVRRHLEDLQIKGYIFRRKTPYGYRIEVLNSCKFGIWARPQKEKLQKRVSLDREKPQNLAGEAAFCGVRNYKIGVYKEDAAVDATEDAAVATTATASPNPWGLLGRDLPMGSPQFQSIFETQCSTRREDRMSDLMERTIQVANKCNVKVPRPFFEAKRVVERKEAEEPTVPKVPEIPLLEAEPWAK